MNVLPLAFSGLLISTAVAFASALPLADLQPEAVQARDPRADVRPRTDTHLRFGDRESAPAVRFVANSEVSYPLPEGENSFSAVLVYAGATEQQVSQALTSSNRLWVRILLDAKPVFETTMDEITPPEQFSIPVAGAHRLTIASGEDYGWNVFALLDAEFSEPREKAASKFLPAKGEGYVDFTPLARQSLFHVFRPGESLPVATYLAGSAAVAKVTMRVTPENSAAPIHDTSLATALHESGGGVSQGAAEWTVPAWRGPAVLDVEERVNGRTAFHRKLRVAIAPEVDLARLSNSSFGIHTSSSGFLTLQDEFASLWGAKWDRALVRWEIVELMPGRYDFSRSDAIVSSLQEQGMRVLGVLGESSPAWARAPGARYRDLWARFVAETVRHYKGRIHDWEVFNEIDVKYEHFRDFDPNFDIELLRSGMESIRKEDPDAKTVCCSPGMTPWLPYYRRLFNAGLLPLIDILSLHPYELYAPEEKDGVFDYEDRLNALKQLTQAAGASRPLWATEANWILGARGAPYVTAPDLDEHTQAEYIVRVNLISWAHSVPYFLHSPFYYTSHKGLHLDSLAAYANMASLFGSAGNPTSLMHGPGVYGYTAQIPGAVVGALWTVSGTATVALGGIPSARFLDFYGNPVPRTISSVAISPAVTYFITAPGSHPQMSVVRPVPEPHWTALSRVETWTRTKESSFAKIQGGLDITSQPAKYTYQLRSPVIGVQKTSCYIARLFFNLEQGSAMLFAIDTATEKRVGDPVYVAYIPDAQFHECDLRFHTESAGSIQLIVANANLTPVVSRFAQMDRAEITQCP